MDSLTKTALPLVEDKSALCGPTGELAPIQQSRASVNNFSGVSGVLSRPGTRAALIFVLVLLCYLPLLPGSFLMDDQRLVELDNPLVNGVFSPRTIWFQTDFPLSTFALWLQWLAWGKNPAGYHAVNIVLQILSAVLIWRLLVRLKIPGAWLAAALFAVHPVAVNSVARIAEIKNTLSLPFFLLSFLLYLHYEANALYPADANQSSGKPQGNRGAMFYGLSLVSFVLALLSKTSTVMLPVVLIGCAAWQRGRISRRDWLHTSPFFFLAAAFGLMSSWFQKYQALAGETLQPSGFWERLAGAGQNFWFYLGKALLPHNLSIVYLRWKVEAATFAAWLPLLLLFAVFILGWSFRRSWGRHALFGLGCFAVTLFPALGFFDAQYLVKFQVSDHLQYLPLIAPLALAGAALVSWLPSAHAKPLGAALILTLAVFTCHRAKVFSTEESLWRDTLAKNPAAAGAHNDLGIILAKRGNLSEASAHFEAALQSVPDDPTALSNLGKVLVMQGRLPEALEHFQAALKSKPGNPAAHENLAQVLSQLGKDREAIFYFNSALRLRPNMETRLNLAGLLYKKGDFHEAAAQYRQVLSLNPKQPEPLNNLAWLLATCPDNRVRDGGEAVRCAEQACRLTGFKETGMTGTLAAAYAEAGRFPDAIAVCEKTVSVATAAGDAPFAAINKELLTLYRAGKPYHEKISAGTARD